jgi:hypothetical protein
MLQLLLFTWMFSTIGFWANPEKIVYPPSKIGLVRNVFAGKLTCSGRLLDIDHFQSWCVKNGKVVQNQVSDISANSVVQISFNDNRGDEVDVSILWWVASVEFNPQTIGYQIAMMVGGKEQPMISGQF